MRIIIDIPEQFESDYKGDMFKDFFSRVMCDIQDGTLCGNYEKETVEMFLKAFDESSPMDRIVEELEEWKDIANYEGIYQISNMGNVRSLDRIVHPNNQYLQKGKILKPLDNGKYLFVTLRKDGVKENKYIHRLVAEHFLPNPLFYNEVNHKDEDKHNNCISNLEWCTHSYNMNYGTRNEKISKTKKAGGKV